MKNLFFVSTLVLLSNCSLFQHGDTGGGGTGGGGTGHQPGTFHPGPYTDPTTGHTCNAPGGWCDDDAHCHSSADKCLKQ